MGRKNRLAGVDPFGGDDKADPAPERDSPASLSMTEADAALFGELTRREGARQSIRTISIFSIYPDVQQPRRAVPSQVRAHWSGEPQDIADMFNTWLTYIGQERDRAGLPPFSLDDLLWSEAVQARSGGEEDPTALEESVGPIEAAFRRVVELAVSIRRDGLANPVSIHRVGRERYRLETGERRWLAFHVLFGYFNGDDGKPAEREKWQNIPAIIVENFNVWRQASENAARADLNAIGRARQFAILMMDLLKEQGVAFKPYDDLVQPQAAADRGYYAQVVGYRVPSGASDMLSNGLGVSHRAAFTRCRILLNLPDEVWTIGDNLNLAEDELLKLAKLEPDDAVEAARAIAANVASRNNNVDTTPKPKSSRTPTLPPDDALNRGKRLFSKQNALLAKQIFEIRDGVGQASSSTKRALRLHITELRRCLNDLETAIDSDA